MLGPQEVVVDINGQLGVLTPADQAVHLKRKKRRNHLRCQAMQDFDIYQATGRLEREANFFAADLLLDDEEVLDLIHSGNTYFFSVAIVLRIL